jgi:hypothetical protein
MSGYHIREALRELGFLLVLAGLALVVQHCTACTPAEDPAMHHQAIVESLSYGVRAADLACASVARAQKDEHLASECAFAYDAARLSLTAAEDKLERDHPEDVSCEVSQALSYARQMASLIEKRSGKLPPSLGRAFALATLLAEGCHG